MDSPHNTKSKPRTPVPINPLRTRTRSTPKATGRYTWIRVQLLRGPHKAGLPSVHPLNPTFGFFGLPFGYLCLLILFVVAFSPKSRQPVLENIRNKAAFVEGGSSKIDEFEVAVAEHEVGRLHTPIITLRSLCAMPFRRR